MLPSDIVLYSVSGQVLEMLVQLDLPPEVGLLDLPSENLKKYNQQNHLHRSHLSQGRTCCKCS